MVNIRRVNSERQKPTTYSPRGEVGEIDTRAPFQSVKAAVSLFGEVAVSRERRTPRKSKLSSENVIDKETQLLLAQKELNNIKQKLQSAETTKAKAVADLDKAKITLQDLTSKLKIVSDSKQSVIEATEGVKKKAKQLEVAKSRKHLESSAQKQELDLAREQYIASASELDAAKQQLNKIRQDFDAALEGKLAAFQLAAEAQSSAKAHSERVTELTKEVKAMKEAIQQLKFAAQQALQEQAYIVGGKEALQKSYQNAKEEAEKKLLSLKKEYDPELTRSLELKLAETTAEIEFLQEEMKKAHASEMDSVRDITRELNEAARTLQLVADEECSLRNMVSSLRLELEDVKREQAEAIKEAERESIAGKKASDGPEERAMTRAEQLPLETENARREAEALKKNIEDVKQEAETARIKKEEVEKKLEIALREAEEAKAAEKKALDGMKALSERQNGIDTESSGKIKISVEEYESLKRKVDESPNMAEMKVAEAMAELETINAGKSKADSKIEANLKSIEEIEAATDMALKAADSAEAAQSVVEGELRKWRQQEETLAA